MVERIDPRSLDVGLLAAFVGYAAQDHALAALDAAGFGDLRVAHGFVVQHLVDGPRTASELAELQGVSVQAISKTTAELVELGYLATTVDPTDGRRRPLALTPRATRSIAASRAANAAIQRRIVRKLGAERVAALTSDLSEVLNLLGGTEAVARRRVRRPA